MGWVNWPFSRYLLPRCFLEGEVFAILHPKRQKVHGASLKRYQLI